MNDFKNIHQIFSLEGSVAAVIGGGGHLCSAMCKGLASAGANVAVLDIRVQKAKDVAEKINNFTDAKSIAVEVDASNKRSLKDALIKINNAFGEIDILINGGGINSPTPFLEISLEEWHKVINSQITSTMLGCQVFGEKMILNGSGSIINISSASAGPPLSKAFPYSVSKAGILNLTMNLAREWAQKGVRVNAIRPGFFPTEWNRKNFIDKEREISILNHTPMKRYGEPHELIASVIWLASKSSSFVTGSEITIDGGFSCMTI